MPNDPSDPLNRPDMPSHFLSLEELYSYQSNVPDPFAAIRTTSPILNRPGLPKVVSHAADPLFLDHEDGEEAIGTLRRDEYFLFKVFLNPDGAELIKRYQNDKPFDRYRGVDIFIYHEWTDRYDSMGTICYVRFSKALSDYLESRSSNRSPEAVARKIAENYNRKRNEPDHDEIDPMLIKEAIVFQQSKGRLSLGSIASGINAAFAEACFFLADAARKGQYDEKAWRDPTAKDYSPLIRVNELEHFRKALVRVRSALNGLGRPLAKLGRVAQKLGLPKAERLIAMLAEVVSDMAQGVQALETLVELGQQAIAMVNALLCGAFNAIHHMLVGLIELVGLVFALDDQANKGLVYESIENAYQLFRQRPFADQFNEKLTEFKDRYDSNFFTSTEIAYHFGEDAVEAAMLVFIVRDVIGLVRKLPRLAELAKTGEKVLSKEAIRAIEEADKGTDYLLKRLFAKEPQKLKRVRDEFGIELFQKQGEEAVQVWYKDTKIFEGDEKAVKDYINLLDKKSTPNRKLFLEEAFLSSKKKIAFESMKSYRKQQNYPEFRNDIDGTGTVATIEVNGERFFGSNSKFSPEYNVIRKQWFESIEVWLPPKKSPPKDLSRVQSFSHAEAHALMMAHNKLGGLPPSVIMFVDRKTCNICKGELPNLMKKMNVQELFIYSSDGDQLVSIKLK